MKGIKFLFALAATFIFGGALASTMGINPAIGAGGVGVTSMFVSQTGVAFAGLTKEIWLNELKEDFSGDDVWISELKDYSAFVDHDVINLAEAGVAPEVLVDNTTYPIPKADRADQALTLELRRFDTENTSLKHADRVELAYNKLESIVGQHKEALRMAFMEVGAHAIAPTADGQYTPIRTSTGADIGNGYKRLKFADLLAMRTAFNQAEIPQQGRIVLLSTQHDEDLRLEDQDKYDKMMDKGMIAGFKIYDQADKRLPQYDTATGNKVAYGATAPATAVSASVFFSKNEVMRAVGTDDMFHGKAEDNPTTREDVIGFARRGLILPIRNKGIGAIYSSAV